MDMTQALSAQLAIILLLSVIPMLGMMQTGRAQRSKIRAFTPENQKIQRQRSNSDHFGR